MKSIARTVKNLPGYNFRNWAENSSCVAENYFQPSTEQELIVAISTGKKVRMIGTGHSWSPLCLCDDTLINLDCYNKILHLDKKNLTVKVQAGIKLWQLNKFLDTHHLALSNLGSISEQSLAGAVSTGTHGTGIQHRILGSQTEEFSIIKAGGEKINIHRERDKELFNLSVVNLGALGAISEITLNVVPAFRLHDHTYVARFDSIINQLDELVKETDHFKLWWFPHIEEVAVYRYTRTQESVNDSEFRQWFMDEFLSVSAFRLLLKIGNIKKDWRKKINHILVNKFITSLDRIEKSYKVFNVAKPPKHREAEWAFDLKDAKEVLLGYKKMLNGSKHRINFLQEVRFTKADDFALSPCYQRDTLWLGCYNADNWGWDELLRDFENFAKHYNGRPHWGKEFCPDKNYLQKQYPLYEKFNSLRKQYDPDGKFENKFIAKIF